MNKFPVLQSGFVASGNLGVSRPDPFVNPNPRSALYESPDQSHTETFFSPEVTKMYQEMTSDYSFFNDFENREKLLNLAFQAFGNTFFGDWVDVQKNYGQIDQVHMDFLIDTARFTCGLGRTLHLMTWLRMINHSKRFENLSFDITKGLSAEQAKDIIQQSAAMPEMISRWVSQPEGYVDLLMTLQIVYGSRDPRILINTK